MFLALVSRCKDEPFVAEFVAYYVSQGVDMLFLLDDTSADQAIYREVLHHPKVSIVHGVGRAGYTAFYASLRGYEWLINVDMDEFIATRLRPEATIRDELETTFKDVHQVQIPWVFMACNGLARNPASVLETNVYRPNYDLPCPKGPHSKFTYHRLFKSIFKPAFFEGIFPHNATDPVGDVVTVNTVNGCLSEAAIRTACLVCYHYRYVSIEHFHHKAATSCFYKNRAEEVAVMLENDHPDVLDVTMRLKSHRIKSMSGKEIPMESRPEGC